MCDIVVKKFTFAISSPDEFLLLFAVMQRVAQVCQRQLSYLLVVMIAYRIILILLGLLIHIMT